MVRYHYLLLVYFLDDICCWSFFVSAKKRHNFSEKVKVMYSNEDSEMFYLDSQRWGKRGMTLFISVSRQKYCSNLGNGKLFAQYPEEVFGGKVVGRPTEESKQRVALPPLSIHPQSEPSFKRGGSRYR